MRTLIHNIGTLAGILPQGKRMLAGGEMGSVGCINKAYLIINEGIIEEFGEEECLKGKAQD